MKETKSKNIKAFDIQTEMKLATNVMFTQMQALHGIKKLGKKAISAMIKELMQLEYGLMPEKKVVAAIDPDTLAYENKKEL